MKATLFLIGVSAMTLMPYAALAGRLTGNAGQ